MVAEDLQSGSLYISDTRQIKPTNGVEHAVMECKQGKWKSQRDFDMILRQKTQVASRFSQCCKSETRQSSNTAEPAE